MAQTAWSWIMRQKLTDAAVMGMCLVWLAAMAWLTASSDGVRWEPALGDAATWAAASFTFLGALANFLVAYVAVWVVRDQRRASLADQARDQLERISDVLEIAEQATFQVRNDFNMLEANRRSALLAGSRRWHLDLNIKTMQRLLVALSGRSRDRLPMAIIIHAAAVEQILSEFIGALERANGKDDDELLGHLLMARHESDAQRSMSIMYARQYLPESHPIHAIYASPGMGGMA